MKVRFTDPEEFLTELRQAPPDAEPVLRATIRHQTDQQTGAFRHLTVVVTYVRLLPGSAEPMPVVVALESYQGEDWGPGFEGSQQTRQRAAELLDRLSRTARECGLEYRAGIYEP